MRSSTYMHYGTKSATANAARHWSRTRSWSMDNQVALTKSTTACRSNRGIRCGSSCRHTGLTGRCATTCECIRTCVSAMSWILELSVLFCDFVGLKFLLQDCVAMRVVGLSESCTHGTAYDTVPRASDLEHTTICAVLASHQLQHATGLTKRSCSASPVEQ